jgi:hypothetical protein
MKRRGHTRSFGDVRSMSALAPESGRPSAILRCRKSARTGLMHRSKDTFSKKENMSKNAVV